MAPPAANVVILNAGAIDDLDCWRSRLNAGFVKLFDVAHVIAHGDIPSSFHEASFVGYAPISPAGFGVPFLNIGGKAESDSGVLTWTFAGGVGTAVIYGWYLVDSTLTKALMASAFLSPVILTPGSPTMSRVIQATAVSEL